MKFGRVENPSLVDHQIPQSFKWGSFEQKSADSEKGLTVYFGAPAWGDRGYIGKIYPPKTKPSDYLYHYSRQFTCIELNTMYYRIPKTPTIEKWIEQVPDSFRFCPKWPQSITNRKVLESQSELTDRFFNTLLLFQEKLGTTFIQLPSHFSTERGKELFTFLGELPSDIPVNVEFRHPSWFESQAIKDRLFEKMDELGLGMVITDTSGRRDVLHNMVTAQKVFIRFTGNSLHKSDYQRLEDWAARISKWCTKAVQEVYFIFHQPEEHYCVDAAIYLSGKMKDFEISTQAPKVISQSNQSNLFV